MQARHAGALPSPRIRTLTADDAEAFAALRRRVVTDFPLGMGLTPAEELLRSLGGFRDQLSPRAPGAVFGIDIDDALVSTASVVWPTVNASGSHKAVLWGVFTDPAFQRQGFARRLVAHAVGHAFTHAARRVYLSVYLPNPKAVALYESFGFVATGIEPEVVRLGDQYFDIQYMSLALTEPQLREAA